jgi:hypothetical protein
MRLIIVARVERTPRLCVLIIQSCRERSIGDPAGELVELTSCGSERLTTPRAPQQVNLACDNAWISRVNFRASERVN